MPFPGNGCKNSKPIKLNVKSGSTKVCFTQPVKLAPTDSKKTKESENNSKDD